MFNLLLSGLTATTGLLLILFIVTRFKSLEIPDHLIPQEGIEQFAFYLLAVMGFALGWELHDHIYRFFDFGKFTSRLDDSVLSYCFSFINGFIAILIYKAGHLLVMLSLIGILLYELFS